MDDLALKAPTPLGRIEPHPIVKIWKQKRRKKKEMEAYKKRRKRPKKGHIDIYV